MSRHADRRLAVSGIGPAIASTILALLLAACAGTGPASPSVDPSVPPATAGPATDVGSLLGDAAPDGKPVTVTGFFLAQDGVAQLCDLVLESYPPQCGGPTVRLTGEVPQAVLDALDSTTEPGLAQATWGQVLVTGTYRAADADGQPTIELTSIEVAGAPS
jgi:hypothetical protein